MPPDLGKTESWVVLDVQPGSRIYAGLKTGCDEAKLRRALGEGAIKDCLHSFEPQPGDCVFIPAGSVHALGAGLLVAEIQQASDTTYRLYDWGRTGPDGKPRTLHIDQALAAIDFSAVEIMPQQPRATQRPAVQRLVSCEKFVLDRWTLMGEQLLNGNNRFHILSVLEGELELPAILRRGQTVLLPACLAEVAIRPCGRTIVLDMYPPD